MKDMDILEYFNEDSFETKILNDLDDFNDTEQYRREQLARGTNVVKLTDNDVKLKAKDDSKETGIRTKYIGTKRVRDLDTGQIFDLEYMEKEVSHNLIKGGWRRVYMENFMEILTECSASKKVKIIDFILSNLDSENKFTQTQDYIAKKIGVSRGTVIETFKYLLSKKFMVKKGTAYVVNTKYVCAFGSDKKNATIAVKYFSKDE